MAAKKTSKTKTAPPPTPTPINDPELVRQLRAYEQAKLTKSLMQQSLPKSSTPLGKASKADLQYASKERLRMEQRYKNANRTTKAAQRYATDIGKNLNIGKNITLPIKGDALSGRTPEGGTRSVLEGFKSFIRGGGLRSSGR
jgi:hypothetical protein